MLRKQFTLYINNKPGTFAKIANKLATAKVNIDGISVAETSDMSLVQLITSNFGKTMKVLDQMKIPFTSQNVAVLNMPNQPGALAGMVSMLGKKGVNINYLYSTAHPLGDHGSCSVVVCADDLKSVEALWAVGK